MADLDTFKRRVGYRIKSAQESYTGTDTDDTYQLAFENVFDVQVFLNDVRYPAEYLTIDGEVGVVKLKGPAGQDAVLAIHYKYAPFTDAEAQALITEYGLDKAVIEALRELLANTARLRNYKSADTEVDNSQVFKQIRELLRMYENEYQSSQSAETGVVISQRKDPSGSSTCRETDISRLYG